MNEIQFVNSHKYQRNESTHGFPPKVFFYSPLHPDANPGCRYLFVRSNTQTMVLLCNAHHDNSFCLMIPILLYVLSEHASLFIISKVLTVSFAEISKKRALCGLWLLGFEETESDPVCLCDSGSKNNHFETPRWEKLSTAPLSDRQRR